MKLIMSSNLPPRKVYSAAFIPLPAAFLLTPSHLSTKDKMRDAFPGIKRSDWLGRCDAIGALDAIGAG